MSAAHGPTTPTLVVTRRLPAEVEARLARRCACTFNPSDTPPDAVTLARALATADAVLCTVTDRFDAATFARAAADGGVRARLLCNFGVGVNHIDLDAARAHGVQVTNTPDVLTHDTADLAMALVLMTLRRLGEGERLVRASAWTGWAPTHHLGHSLEGRTLGIVGWGRIGRATARRAHHGFGLRVVYHTPHPERHPEPWATPCPTLDALLEASDVVSLHCPATAATRGLIDRRALARMRPGAVLVNTARGDVVDEAALVDALASGRLAAAGLDVYADEPRVPAALRALPNVVLLPHLGSATVETRRAMGMRAASNLEAWLDGREPPDRVA